ncbi:MULTISPECIES: DNA helicase PcrA [unclassified Thermosynechococcus]|uniref:DNA helicase PcrA n=1 Tax=unclassified Thermosynechococcus TaxID=2622553 RepID=UPI002673DBB5|nr:MULTISPECIES: DNA helicase PcrA [unclassified Thermosynechococcus]WKT84953.1 DNA helicase PcrA [Thermosynechococcus sp. HY596]WNC64087.1 DNA helicase PcrA [Thermosynechococcus sp. HY591]WNC66654.1 DNA helicase PcrA [Thermosynechococcus sp. HY593]
MSRDFLAGLNPSQRRAVEHYCGPMLVVAGAGSGKTRTLTYRIAHLIRQHQVAPENILAVTFTNKAAREMKERLEALFGQEVAQQLYRRDWLDLSPLEQQRVRSRVYQTYTKSLWIGTFHSLCARLLRLEIEAYQHPQGYRWTRHFTIFDESDVQSLIKEIATAELNLDERQHDPRGIRYKISHAKNRGLSPDQLEQEQRSPAGRVAAEVYRRYEATLAQNNALDFDDLILRTVQLLQQHPERLEYWHQQFQHILVDEYQDTNRTQYNLIRLLATNGTPPQQFQNWGDRSIFVVGDVDQSIYSFRCADFTILMNFQQDFGDRLPDNHSRTMIKLEENYRSTANILQAANHLIEHNNERIDKVLRPTKGEGAPIHCECCDTETDEADFVARTIKALGSQSLEPQWGRFAILYRTNAQSRPFEEALVRANIPYTVVGGLKFYERKEVKDVLAYLRLLQNPQDTVSLRRIINVPRRGIGKTSLDRLSDAAQTLGISLWDLITDTESMTPLAGRASRAVQQFVTLMTRLRSLVDDIELPELVKTVIEETGYRRELENEGTDESLERLQNLMELVNAAQQFSEENEGASLSDFLNSSALASDLDTLQEGEGVVSLMTLHAAKGLEFPVVFLVGMEQGLFPNFRSLNDPMALEEERRLCYVGITRAQEQLFLTFAQSRRRYGGSEDTIPSQFLTELPPELLTGNVQRRPKMAAVTKLSPARLSKAAASPWRVGDRILHPVYGEGEITHVFNTGSKLSLAIRFPRRGQKVVDPRLTPLERL